MSKRPLSCSIKRNIFQIQDLNFKKAKSISKSNISSLFPFHTTSFSYQSSTTSKNIRKKKFYFYRDSCFNNAIIHYSKKDFYNKNHHNYPNRFVTTFEKNSYLKKLFFSRAFNNKTEQDNISVNNNNEITSYTPYDKKIRDKSFFNSGYKNSLFAKKIKFYLNRVANEVKTNKNNSVKNHKNIFDDINGKTNYIKLDFNKIFMTYIDNINTDKSNIIKYKKELHEYFDDNNNDNISSYFNDLLNNTQFEINDKENEDYFSNDSYSSKKNNFMIKNLDITFKISSLKLIFYEIIYNNKFVIETNNRNNSKNNNTNNTAIKKLNTKIKMPFKFLPLFYGLNFEDFINLLISLIDYDFDKNKFFIKYDNFITKVGETTILYDLYKENSFINIYNSNNEKEYFLYDWELKGKNNEEKHFCIKILLPQIKIRIKYQGNNKAKFYSYINHKTMYNLIKNSFNKWEFFILIYFSQYKLFRDEINKIISRNSSNIQLVNMINKYNNNQNVVFNLTNSNIQANTNKNNYTSYDFFYSYLKDGIIENYYINFKLPKINVNFYSFKKNFDLDYRRFHQLNKLRKYFMLEDIIKYSMIINTHKEKINFIEIEKPKIENEKKLKKHKENQLIKLPSSQFIDGKRKKSTRAFLKNNIKKNKEENNLNNIIKENYKFREIITDVKLNLDKYIFNFDEKILNCNHIKDFYKTYNKDYHEINDHNNCNTLSDNNNKKLVINIDNLEVSLINKDGLKYKYNFDKSTSQYLLDFSKNKWKSYLIKNIEKIIKGESI